MQGFTTIEMNGRQVDLLYGLFAIQRIFEKLGGLTADMNESRKSLAVYKHILYSGYLCNCEAMDEKPTLNARDFQVFIEECARNNNMDPVIDAVSVYNKSTEVKEVPGENEKKNVNSTGKKSNSSAYEKI